MMKYICITGGVISGIGKGTVSSSIGAILKSRGYRITFLKIDPYLNHNAGLMSPAEHGEIYVLEDGSETDLDLGNYERFTEVTLSEVNVMTSGKLFYNVINKEKQGSFLGKTVRCNPHLIDEIIASFENVARTPVKEFGSNAEVGLPEITLIELGGTIGDLESLIYTEALSKFVYKVGKSNMLFISVEYLVELATGEQKTRPLQASYKVFRNFGLQNDMIICRNEHEISKEARAKISYNCCVPENEIYHLPNLDSVYSVPEYLEKEGIYESIHRILGLEKKNKIYELSSKFGHLVRKYKSCIRVGIITKYDESLDGYVAVEAALKFSAASLKSEVEFVWIDAGNLEKGDEECRKALGVVNCILVPGGFGSRGIEGKIKAINYARINKIPFLGICLGFQLAVIEFCRNVLGIKDATSTEFEPDSKSPVVSLIEDRLNKTPGGELRLGKSNISVIPKTIVGEVYKRGIIPERHRHRYEINSRYLEDIEKSGLVKFVGKDESTGVMEILEGKDHPFYVGVQFHPEFHSRPTKAHPVFTGLIAAAISEKCKKKN